MASDQVGPLRREVVVPSEWRGFYDAAHIPAAVWVGNTLRLSGHTGEDADGVYSADVEEQIRGTFRNIASTLAVAGARWSDVVEIHSYHVEFSRQTQALLPIRCLAIVEDRRP
jgi:enamine deaminase RidA (YjgF/YER057c/UK114 family)